MTKLHELIAVEPERKSSAVEKLKVALALFNNGQVRLNGATRTYQPSVEGGDTFEDEITVLATTAVDVLNDTMKDLSRWTDVAVQKEAANADASAAIILNGKAITAELPVGALLNLENKLLQWKQVVEAIPTLDPSESWTLDSQKTNVWKSDPKATYRTSKKTKFVTVAESTDKHAAQVQQVTEDERVGIWTSTKFSGNLSEVQKKEMLERVNELIQEVKAARERANDVVVDTSIKLGNTLFGYVVTGEL